MPYWFNNKPTCTFNAILKNKFVSDPAAEWELYFLFLPFFLFLSFFFQKMTVIFYTHNDKKKEGKKNNFADARLATILATRLTENKLVFKRGLMAHKTFDL